MSGIPRGRPELRFGAVVLLAAALLVALLAAVFAARSPPDPAPPVDVRIEAKRPMLRNVSVPAVAPTPPGPPAGPAAPTTADLLARAPTERWILEQTLTEGALVACVVGDVLPGARHGISLPETGPVGMVEIRDGVLLAQVPRGSGAVKVSFREVGGGTVRYSNPTGGPLAECAGADLRPVVGVHGRVVGEPVPGASVAGCGDRVEIEEGRFFLLTADTECTLEVWALRGDEAAVGPARTVRPVPGEEVEVELAYPTEDAFGPLEQ